MPFKVHLQMTVFFIDVQKQSKRQFNKNWRLRDGPSLISYFSKFLIYFALLAICFKFHPSMPLHLLVLNEYHLVQSILYDFQSVCTNQQALHSCVCLQHLSSIYSHGLHNFSELSYSLNKFEHSRNLLINVSNCSLLKISILYQALVQFYLIFIKRMIMFFYKWSDIVKITTNLTINLCIGHPFLKFSPISTITESPMSSGLIFVKTSDLEVFSI